MAQPIMGRYINGLAKQCSDGTEYSYRCASCRAPIRIYTSLLVGVVKTQCGHCGCDYKIRISLESWQVEGGRIA